MIEINPKIIQPKELEERVVESLQSKNLAEISFFDLNSKKIIELYKTLHFIRNNFTLRELPIQYNTSITGRCYLIIKKIIRKATRWLFKSYINQQNEFNGRVVKMLEDMLEIQKSLMLVKSNDE